MITFKKDKKEKNLSGGNIKYWSREFFNILCSPRCCALWISKKNRNIFLNEISNRHKVYERKFCNFENLKILIMRITEVVNGELGGKKTESISELLDDEHDPVIISAQRFY